MNLRDWSWTSAISPAGYKPIVLNHDGVRPTQALIPYRGKYLAMWEFDEEFDTGRSHLLIVKLSRREARKILSRDPYSVGFLEAVRGTMEERVGVLVVQGGDLDKRGFWRTFVVPSNVSEDEFLAALDDASELPEHLTQGHRVESEAVRARYESAPEPLRNLVPALAG